ncbi:hypothetical protein PAECIP111802_07194 [Paenibacillus allorhizosphaerae]|uniref:Uncharacterized protein n=1 Tax=Paenibacillus allorhizosphaerae TaxID=2849866 RepID=A0ABM8VUD3_9BACL|nr:hypothetical protein PAECIP111802_07194 [Paenibacillus allorhizosphaerae]
MKAPRILRNIMQKFAFHGGIFLLLLPSKAKGYLLRREEQKWLLDGRSLWGELARLLFNKKMFVLLK